MSHTKFIEERAAGIIPGYTSPSAKLLQGVMQRVAERNPNAPVFVEQPSAPYVGMPAGAVKVEHIP